MMCPLARTSRGNEERRADLRYSGVLEYRSAVEFKFLVGFTASLLLASHLSLVPARPHPT